MATNSLEKDLLKILDRSQVRTGELDRRLYSYDSSFLARRSSFIPDAVLFPRSTEQVSAILKYASSRGIPVIPRGAGTGETCGCLAARGGLVLDLSPWNTVDEVDTSNMQSLVRPGVVHARFNKHLSTYGLFFPPDPGSSQMCTLGGMIANNSSGLRAVKYGTTENYVLGLEVVLPDGEIIITGGKESRAIKNVSGLNLTKLFVGSEGTLGVITRARLKLWPKPAARGLVMATFPRLEDAPPVVEEVYRAGIMPSGVEILDGPAIRAVNMYRPETNLPEVEAILLFEVDGSPPGVEWEGEKITRIVRQAGGNAEWSTHPKRMAELWQGRSLVAAAAARIRPDGTRIFAGEDISVPLNKVAKALREIHKLGREFGITVITFGHIGDGNIHTAPVINIDSQEEIERADALVDAIHRLAVKLKGSTTGEHGVGLVRADYAELEHGKALDAMKKVKKALDPGNIMNPGKIWP